FGNAIHQHATGLVERLEHRDLMSELREIGRGRQPRGAGADDRDLASGRGRSRLPALLWREPRRRVDGGGEVGDESFEPPDGHRLEADAQRALLLALVFLRTYTPADGGQ